MTLKPLKWPVYHVLISSFAILMLYPLIWMLMSSFKESELIFVTANSLIPDPWVWINYIEGWQGIGKQTFAVFVVNSFIICLLMTIGHMISCSLIAFGFARLDFAGRKVWFTIMLLSLMLPLEVLMIPQYILFAKIGWLNSILPIVVPAFFGHVFFIFLMVQFVRTIPLELDEAATIDGCGKFKLFYRIILPLIMPALATTAIFSFYWAWENLLGPLLYLNSPGKYTVSLGLKMFLDNETASNWGAMFAMSIVTLIPVFIIFLIFQKYIVEGISTSGLKG